MEPQGITVEDKIVDFRQYIFKTTNSDININYLVTNRQNTTNRLLEVGLLSPMQNITLARSAENKSAIFDGIYPYKAPKLAQAR